MRYTLENDTYRISVDSHGAELRSVLRKADDREYMWQGDPKYWNRTSPVLFPIVGSLRDGHYTYLGNEYSLGQHGFARDMEFTMESQNEESIWFRLTETPETLEKYPFAFMFHIGYELKGNELKVSWKVRNLSDGEMYFSIGAHPAFNCPINGEDSKEGYILQFKNLDVLNHYGNERAHGLAIRDEVTALPLENGQVSITKDFFDKCTYIVDGKQTGEVSLADPSGHPYVTVKFDAPLFGIWSPEEKNAPFLCIEPWYGRCDDVTFDGTLEEREHGNQLVPGEMFEAEYTMSFD